MDQTKQPPHINVDYFEDLTGEITGEKAGTTVEIGERIRSLREARGLSLEDLSKMTGFDTDLLASIEKKETQPPLGTMMRLSKALDSAFSRILSDVGEKLYSITRKDEQIPIRRATGKKGKQHLYSYKSLAPDVKGRHMEALIVELAENPEKEMSVHDGEEFIHVLDGVVLLNISGEEFELYPGDSAYYLSTTLHVISAKSGAAKILAVLYE